MTRVVCYIRQSDEEGHKKDLSCPSQERRFLMDVAARQTMGEELEYEIAPWDQGKSGGEIDRPGIQWVLANLDRFDEVWVYDHDRLAREAYYGPYIMKELRSRGIRLWVSTGGSDEDTPMGRFMTDLRLRFGALYREQVAEKSKENRDHRLREGLWVNHAPTGYKFVFENGEGSRRLLVPDPETAETVRELFRLMADGTSQKQAARELGLNTTTVLWWRDNPLYIGLVYKHRKNIDALPDRSHFALWALALDPDCDFLYPGKHEPIIDAETWDQLQARHVPGGTRAGRGPSARWPSPVRSDASAARSWYCAATRGTGPCPSGARPAGGSTPTSTPRTPSWAPSRSSHPPRGSSGRWRPRSVHGGCRRRRRTGSPFSPADATRWRANWTRPSMPCLTQRSCHRRSGLRRGSCRRRSLNSTGR